MDYENYIELYEAVYLFHMLSPKTDIPLSAINAHPIAENSLAESVWRAVIRILAVNGLLDVNENGVRVKNREEYQYILDNIILKNPKHYQEMLDKALNESQFFFDSISELEYEIYSRCNFQITFETGKDAVKHFYFNGCGILELGGNSGGFASAVLSENKDCLYTVVDTGIPCAVGREFNKFTNLTFIEGNIFKLALPGLTYDYIIFTNLLHDFDDIKCSEILRGCMKYFKDSTKFIVIEDILTNEYEPKEIIMHGLRLSVECRGGRQRTVDEFMILFESLNCRIERVIKLNNIHTMLIIKRGCYCAAVQCRFDV